MNVDMLLSLPISVYRSASNVRSGNWNSWL